MSRLWVKAMRKGRIEQQMDAPCAWGEQHDALGEIAKQMDLPMPMWLRKHEKEWENHRRTAFLPEHFVEDVHFDRLEIEYLDDTGKKRKSSDPRNQF